MQLKYGNYSFDSNSCELKSHIETLRNRGNIPYAQKRSIEVIGYLYGDGQAEVDQAISGLKTALSYPYRDLILYLDSGAESDTCLYNTGSTSGVVIAEGPDFMDNDGGEYNTYRKFRFRAEAEYPLNGTQNFLLYFTESLAFSGGMPYYTHRLAINGLPQKQLVYPATVYKVVQRGEAIGYLKKPKAPGPIWPSALKEAPDIQETSPDVLGQRYQGYGLTWSYTFESAVRLVGAPNLWKF